MPTVLVRESVRSCLENRKLNFSCTVARKRKNGTIVHDSTQLPMHASHLKNVVHTTLKIEEVLHNGTSSSAVTVVLSTGLNAIMLELNHADVNGL